MKLLYPIKLLYPSTDELIPVTALLKISSYSSTMMRQHCDHRLLFTDQYTDYFTDMSQ